MKDTILNAEAIVTTLSGLDTTAGRGGIQYHQEPIIQYASFSYGRVKARSGSASAIPALTSGLRVRAVLLPMRDRSEGVCDARGAGGGHLSST